MNLLVHLTNGYSVNVLENKSAYFRIHRQVIFFHYSNNRSAWKAETNRILEEMKRIKEEMDNAKSIKRKEISHVKQIQISKGVKLTFDQRKPPILKINVLTKRSLREETHMRIL